MDSGRTGGRTAMQFDIAGRNKFGPGKLDNLFRKKQIMGKKHVFLLCGYVFVAVISLLSAYRFDEVLWRCLLIVSAIISLALAIIRIIDSKKTAQDVVMLKKELKRRPPVEVLTNEEYSKLEKEGKVENDTMYCFVEKREQS